MKAKTKSLEALLRFRQSVERMQWLRLQAIHAEEDKLGWQLAGLEDRRGELKSQFLRSLGRGMEGRVMGMYSTAGIERSIEQAKTVLRSLQEKFQAERAVYMDLRQQRETVENALVRLRAELRKEEERRAQMRIDDETLQRRSRLEREAKREPAAGS